MIDPDSGEARERVAASRQPLALAWAAVVALSPGWATYAVSRGDPVSFIERNDPAQASIFAACLHLLASALLVGALAAFIGRARAGGAIDKMFAGFAKLRMLVLWPLLVALLSDPEGILSARRPILVVACAVVVACTVPPFVPNATSRAIRRVLGSDRWPLVVIGVGAGVVAMLLGKLAVLRHVALQTRAFDLGIYDNILWNTSHGRFLACSLVKSGVHTAAHFDPILAFLVPFYMVAPRAETLLVVQTLWLVSGVIPLWFIAFDVLGERRGATVVALAFLLNPSLHGVALSEFHSLALLSPLALWLIVFVQRGKTTAAFVTLALVLMVREDAALFAVGIGIWALFLPDRRNMGVAFIAVSIAYLAFVKLFVMADASLLMDSSDSTYAYENRYRRLIPEGSGARGALVTLASNPGFLLAHVLTAEKLAAFVTYLLPLGFLPLASGKRLLPCAYGLAFCFLASHQSLFYPYFHYASVLYPVLFAALPSGIALVATWLARRGVGEGEARHRVLAFLVTCSILASLTLGGLVENSVFRLHTEVVRNLDGEQRATYRFLREAIAEIPDDATVVASNRTAPHLTNRESLYIVQQGRPADFAVVHVDDLAGEEVDWFRRDVALGRFEVVTERGRLSVYRRVD